MHTDRALDELGASPGDASAAGPTTTSPTANGFPLPPELRSKILSYLPREADRLNLRLVSPFTYEATRTLRIKSALTPEDLRNTSCLFYEFDTTKLTLKAESEQRFTDDDLKRVPRTVQNLSVRGAKFSAEGLNELFKMPNLTHLSLTQCELNSREAKVLAAHPTLTSISLIGNRIDDTAAEDLAKMANLKCLVLSSNQLTGKGACVLARSPSLRMLTLKDNKITDDIIADEGRQAFGKECSIEEVDLSFPNA